MKKIIFILCFLSLLSCATGVDQKNKKEVKLSGDLKHFPKTVFLTKEEAQALLLEEGETFKLDSNNKFQLTFSIDTPAYYRLGRNFLYLSPGDSLVVNCDYKAPEKAIFSGTKRAVEACDYLKVKPFPKAGSFLNMNFLAKKPTMQQVKQDVEKVKNARQKKLEALKYVDDRFRRLETARNRFDVANSFSSYGFYGGYMQGIYEEEKMKKFMDKAWKFFKGDFNNYTKQVKDADFLNIDTYRILLENFMKMRDEESFPPEVFDYVKTRSLLNNLSEGGLRQKIFKQKEATLKEIQTDSYSALIKKAFSKYDNLSPGKTAPELMFFNAKGDTVSLSDFKGKVVVIDVWATWCGPCKQQAPYFDKIAKKYTDNKNVAFISISIDADRKAWEKYINYEKRKIPEFVCDRVAFEQYQLTGVPRFMIIDKEGKFIEAFAPVPSDKGFEELITHAVKA